MILPDQDAVLAKDERDHLNRAPLKIKVEPPEEGPGERPPDPSRPGV